MRNVRVNIFLIIVILIIGIIIGSINTVGQRSYFEQAKNDFEQSIDNPNHINLPTIVETDKSTKVAQKIDNSIYGIFKKILNKIASN